MKKLLEHHLQDHETYDVGSYVSKTSQKAPASATEVLDWAPALIEILGEVPSGLLSTKSLVEGFEESLTARPLANPFLGVKRLCCLRPQISRMHALCVARAFHFLHCTNLLTCVAFLFKMKLTI